MTQKRKIVMQMLMASLTALFIGMGDLATPATTYAATLVTIVINRPTTSTTGSVHVTVTLSNNGDIVSNCLNLPKQKKDYTVGSYAELSLFSVTQYPDANCKGSPRPLAGGSLFPNDKKQSQLKLDTN